MENQIAKTMVEIEKTRGAVVLNDNLLKEANSEAEKYANELLQLEASVKRNTHIMESKMQLIDQLSKKLDSILARSGVSICFEILCKALKWTIAEVLLCFSNRQQKKALSRFELKP